jgi:hypothetical protein
VYKVASPGKRSNPMATQGFTIGPISAAIWKIHTPAHTLNSNNSSSRSIIGSS